MIVNFVPQDRREKIWIELYKYNYTIMCIILRFGFEYTYLFNIWLNGNGIVNDDTTTMEIPLLLRNIFFKKLWS